jgi:hypothetical protein
MVVNWKKLQQRKLIKYFDSNWHWKWNTINIDIVMKRIQSASVKQVFAESFMDDDICPYSKSSLTLNEWRFNLSFSRVSLLFLNSWRASVVPYCVTAHPLAIQKQHWHSREAQIEPPLIECEWAFRIRAIETSQSSQESESDHDIGTKASTYSVSTQVQDWKKCIQLA